MYFILVAHLNSNQLHLKSLVSDRLDSTALFIYMNYLYCLCGKISQLKEGEIHLAHGIGGFGAWLGDPVCLGRTPPWH